MAFDESKTTKHPAFGMISVSHVSGRHNLFMVDYPQHHFITLRIAKADLNRELAHDWTFRTEEIVEVEMSEVQWARLISSPNTQGVPCTLADYRDPKTGQLMRPTLPDNHVGKAETFAGEVKAFAKQSATELKAALKLVEELMAGGPVKKTDLAKVKEKLYFANMHLAENLSFVVKQAEEVIQTATESGKAEVDAHIDFALSKLGERALGDRLQAAIDAGVDVKQIGRSVADAVTEKA